jgi:hypothetical protein
MVSICVISRRRYYTAPFSIDAGTVIIRVTVRNSSTRLRRTMVCLQGTSTCAYRDTRGWMRRSRRAITQTRGGIIFCWDPKGHIYSRPELPAFRFKETMQLFNIDIDLSRRDARYVSATSGGIPIQTGVVPTVVSKLRTFGELGP